MGECCEDLNNIRCNDHCERISEVAKVKRQSFFLMASATDLLHNTVLFLNIINTSIPSNSPLELGSNSHNTMIGEV